MTSAVRFCLLCEAETEHADAMPEYPAWRCIRCGTLLDRRLEDNPSEPPDRWARWLAAHEPPVDRPAHPPRADEPLLIAAPPMTAREGLDLEMRAVLVQLSTCSHAPAAGGGGGKSSDESPGGGRPPGDNALEYYERAYGPPFHVCEPGCRHRTKPAENDERRAAVIKEAKAQLNHLRGFTPILRPPGETTDELKKRIRKQGVGVSVKECAASMRCLERLVILARKEGGLNVHDGREPEPCGDPDERRRRAREMYSEKGMTIAQIVQVLHVSRSTIKRDLGLDGRRAA